MFDAKILTWSLGLILHFITIDTLAQDNCDHCNRVVELNSKKAECFISQYPDKRKRLINSGVGYVKINLEVCDSTKLQKDNPKQVGDTLPDIKIIKSSIFLDLNGIDCLKNHIEKTSFSSFNPSKIVALRKVCHS